MQEKCISVKMKPLCLDMFNRYIKHIGSSLAVQFKCAGLDVKHLQLYTKVSAYIIIMTGERLKELTLRRGRAIKANNVASVFVSGIVKNEKTGLFSLKLSLDEYTSRELGMSLVLAGINMDDITTVLTVPILQCRATHLMEQTLATLLALVIDTGFPINMNDLLLMRCQRDDPTGRVIPIVGNVADQIEHLYVQSISIWFYSGERPFILQNLRHATKEKCLKQVCCVDANLVQLPLKDKMMKTRGNSSYTIQDSYPLMGQYVPTYGLFTHAGGDPTLQEEEKAVALPKFTWLTESISVNKTHVRRNEEEYRVVTLDSAPKIPDFMTTTYKKSPAGRVTKDALPMLGQIDLEDNNDDTPYETITKFIDQAEIEEVVDDHPLELPELTTQQVEIVSNAVNTVPAKKTLRFDADTVARDDHSSALNSTALADGSPRLTRAPFPGNVTTIPKSRPVVIREVTRTGTNTANDDTNVTTNNNVNAGGADAGATNNNAAQTNENEVIDLVDNTNRGNDQGEDLTSQEGSNADDAASDDSNRTGVARSKNPLAEISSLLEDMTLLDSDSNWNNEVLSRFYTSRRFNEVRNEVTRLLESVSERQEPGTVSDPATITGTVTGGASRDVSTNPFEVDDNDVHLSVDPNRRQTRQMTERITIKTEKE